MKRKIFNTGIILTPVFLVLTLFISQVRADDHPYGWSPDLSGGPKGPPACTDAKPDKPPVLLQPNHPILPKKAKAGEIVMYWHKVPGANGYNIYYGFSPNNYIYSAADIGDTDNFTIRFLQNRVYYFAIQAKSGCAASGLSNAWAARPGSSQYYSGSINYNSRSVLGSTTTSLIRKRAPIVAEDTIVVPTSIPTEPSVQGISVENNPIDTPLPVYQPPADVLPIAPAVVTPKPKSFWDNLKAWLFGK